METYSYKTKNGDNPKNKPRIYFTCHAEDYALCFEKIANDIFKTHDCAIYYTKDMNEPFSQEDLNTDLGQMNLFVVPVTARLLTQPNRAMSVDIAYAKQIGIPILPFMMEENLDELYAKPENFGQLQYLAPYSADITAIRYEEKLKKHLDSVLISDELAKQIRAAFDAYIFLSYRKKDRRYANDLMKLIHKNPECRDIAIWYDEFLTPGESFVDSIQKALEDSKLFALLVTPNLLEEPEGKPNYVMAEEYPAAKRAHKIIFPAEMEDTDHDALAAKYEDIPACVKPAEEETFKRQLLQAIQQIAKPSSNDEPEHRFLMGLAYFEGIDMEVDRERGLALITSAAEADLVEAMERLIHIYKDGNSDQQQALFWSQRLADHYYKNSFDPCGILQNPESIQALFSHYTDEYWQDVITYFLLQADQKLDWTGIDALYDLVLRTGIAEYSLLFEAASRMVNYKEKTQLILVEKLLRDAVDGTSPPYGPLFWYIPEYGLYETAIQAAWNLKGNGRAAALVRDVCFIFGQYDRAKDISTAVDGVALYHAALPALSGVRQGLCELFYTGGTDFDGGRDIYPRCFNLEEALSLAATGMGLNCFMPTLFEDELGLFGVTETSENLSGLVVLPYDENVEQFLAGNIRFVRGFIFLNTDNGYMDYLEFYRKNIRVLYIPENCTEYAPNYALHMPLELSLLLPEKHKKAEAALNKRSSHMYVRRDVLIPDEWTNIPERFFQDCTSLQTVSFPEKFSPPKSIRLDEDEELSDKETEDEPVCLTAACFRNCVNLTGTIVLPKNVDQISNHTFQNCRNLEEVIFPPNFRSIGVEAFAGCTALRGTLTFKNYIESIDDSAFLACTSLTEISFQGGIEYIGGKAFKNCTSLKTVIFGQGMRIIGDGAFYGSGLQHLRFPKEVSITVAEHLPQWVHDHYHLRFYPYTFAYCPDLEDAILPDDLDVIPKSCFEACEKLQSVNWPAKLHTVEAYAFAACALTKLDIPSHVQQIGNGAFAHNPRLTHIRIQNPSIQLGQQIFSGCKHITQAVLPESLRQMDLGLPQNCQITWTAMEEELKSQGDPHLYIRDLRRIPEAAYQQNKALKQVTIADAVAIDSYAFRDCVSLEQVTVTKELTQLGEWAFAKCAKLEAIPFLPQVKQLGAGAFEHCVSLKEAVLHPQIESLEGWIFSGCRNLQQVTLPAGLKRIAAGAFENCHSLQLNSSLSQVTEIEENAFADCAALTALDLPAVETIGNNAFWGCGSLTRITLGSPLHSLGESAFRKCTALQELHLEETALDMIAKGTFLGCHALKVISLPAGLHTIGDTAFLQCTALEELRLPSDTLNELQEAAFAGCKSLKTIDIHKVIYLPGFLFHDCSALETVVLSPQLKVIGKGTFADCIALKEFSMGAEVTEIGERAFYNCTSLRSIKIPLSVKTIGDKAFANCEALELVEISRNFQEDIQRIFGAIDPQCIRFLDTSQAVHQHREQLLQVDLRTPAEKLDFTGCLISNSEGLSRTYAMPPLELLQAPTDSAAEAIPQLSKALESDAFQAMRSPLAFPLGQDQYGDPVLGDLAKLRHLRIAGKNRAELSGYMNAILTSLLYKAAPNAVKLVLIDSQKEWPQLYGELPHLLLPVITDAADAAAALQWLEAETMRRYQAMTAADCRDFTFCNAILEGRDGSQLPQIVLVIRELADLMQPTAWKTEELLCRIAQYGALCGIHLIVAMQCADSNIPSSLVKLYIPALVTFALASIWDSHRILYASGAEKLLGRGDLLYHSHHTDDHTPQLLQAYQVSLQEAAAVAGFVGAAYPMSYSMEITEQIKILSAQLPAAKNEEDALLSTAVEIFLDTRVASVAMLQRRMKLGYARAAKLVDEMEAMGIVGPFLGSKPRELLISKEQWETMKKSKKATD